MLFDNMSIDGEKDKNFYFLDCMKFLMSLIVIFLHTNILTNYDISVKLLICKIFGRMVVPIFFMTSGYLLFRKFKDDDEYNKKIIKRYLTRLTKLYILWSILYIPFILHTDQQKITLKYIILKIWRTIVETSYYQLWYFPALIFGVFLVYILLKYIKVEKILILSIVFYVIGLFGQTYYGVIENIEILNKIFNKYTSLFMTTRNGLFMGFFFVTLGLYFSKKKIVIKFKNAMLGFVLSTIAMTIELLLVSRADWIYNDVTFIFLIPSTFFLFYLITHVKLKERECYIYLRESSTLIFCVHKMFIDIYTVLFRKLEMSINDLSMFIIVAISSIVFSFIVIYLVRKKDIKILKNLY